MKRPTRVRTPYVERLVQSLSARDWAIIDTVSQFHLASGIQLQRLHFADLSLRSQPVMRWRVLKRLVDRRILAPLERRIGSAKHGSDKLVYALDSAGQRLLRLRANAEAPEQALRRPRLPGDRFISHTLAVTELYVTLVEHSRIGTFVFDHFDAEPAAWVRDGRGGWLKPDAFARLHLGDVSDFWWIEVDMATESLPTIRNKLAVYLDFVTRGEIGPDGVVPRVIVGVAGTARQLAVQRLVNSLPQPAEYLFRVVELTYVAVAMEHTLMEV